MPPKRKKKDRKKKRRKKKRRNRKKKFVLQFRLDSKIQFVKIYKIQKKN